MPGLHDSPGLRDTPGLRDDRQQRELPQPRSQDEARRADFAGPGDRPGRGSAADLMQRLERLPHGHPSSPYHDDGTPRPPLVRLKNLELPLPGEEREPNGGPRRDSDGGRLDSATQDGRAWTTEPAPRDPAAVAAQPESAAASGEPTAPDEPAAAPGDLIAASSEPATASREQEAIVQEPVTSVPAVWESAAAEPTVWDPVAPEPAVWDPVAAEPTVWDPAAAEPTVWDPVVAEPTVWDPVVAEPAIWTPAPWEQETAVQDQHATQEPASQDQWAPQEQDSLTPDQELAQSQDADHEEQFSQDEQLSRDHEAGLGDDEPATQDQEAIIDDREPPAAEHPQAERAERLTPEQVRIALRAHGQCRLAEGRSLFGSYSESGLTPAMRRIEEQLDHGELAPDTEKYALKSLDRFQEKLAKLIDDEPGLAPEELADGIHDGVRYTFLFDADKYAHGVRNTETRLEEHGYGLQLLRNTWDSDQYKGINSRWYDPSSGKKFEVQFHTSDSWEAKQLTHDAYEKIDALETPTDERERLKAYQREVCASIPIPQGCLEIADYLEENGPRND
jgi:hypothetical protein